MIGERLQFWVLPVSELEELSGREYYVSSFSWRKVRWDKNIVFIYNDKEQTDNVILHPYDDPTSTKKLVGRQINRAHLRIVEPDHEGQPLINYHPRLIYRKKNGTTLMDKICKTVRENFPQCLS